MPNKLSVAELTDLYIARQKAQAIKNSALQQRLAQTPNPPQSLDDPLVTTMVDKLKEALAALIAKRLHTDDRTVPLVAPQDLISIITVVMREMSQSEPSLQLPPDEEQEREQFCLSFVQQMFQALQTMVPQKKDPYDAHNAWITVVTGLASERNVRPVDLIFSPENEDEICRRLYSKAEFLMLHQQAIDTFFSPEALKRIFTEPLKTALGAQCEDEAERAEMRRQIESDLETGLVELSAKIQQVANEWNEWYVEEADRIYGA